MKNRTHRSLSCLLLTVCFLLPLLTACGGGNYRNDLASEAVTNAIVAALPASDGYKAVENDYISASDWGENYTDLLDALSDHSILLSAKQDSNVDEIGVFHIKEGGDRSKALAVVKEYVTVKQTRLRSLLESYNPGELPKVENGKVTVCGEYILYTILGDSETATAHRAFEDALKVETE